MKLIPDNRVDFQFQYRKGDLAETWFFGDFLKKTTTLLKDDQDEKIKLEVEIYNIQNTDWDSVEIYDKKLRQFANTLSGHIVTHEDPFTL